MLFVYLCRSCRAAYRVVSRKRPAAVATDLRCSTCLQQALRLGH
ncbi:MJ0042-type zinc finger domain-containing protein [Hymenobacter psoromatis]